MIRKTKIITTVGPSTQSKEMLKKLITAGVDIFRLNMAHTPHDVVRKATQNIRKISKELDCNVGILMDTQGPAIRTGELPSKLNLKIGDVFTFTPRGHKSEEEYSVDTNYDDLIKDVKVGDQILVDNGVIHMKVLSKKKGRLRCEVLTQGQLGSRRHINLPGVKVNLPPLTEKDLADIALGVECEVDFIALSFVREKSDVLELRKELKRLKSNAFLIAKIEDQSAIKNIKEIIAAADGIMIARGDLGIECPYEELPIIQRSTVKRCIREMKPVIIATHLLESMISTPVPTRAEITDVANAVFEEADAIMLSGETAIGKYPLRCVKVLERVALRIEKSGGAGYTSEIVLKEDLAEVVAAAIHLANKIHATAICVFTKTGYLGSVTAGLRPTHSIIYAMTPSEDVCRKMALHYGIKGIQIPFSQLREETIQTALKTLKQKNFVRKGQRIVFISDIKHEGTMLSSVQLRIVE